MGPPERARLFERGHMSDVVSATWHNAYIYYTWMHDIPRMDGLIETYPNRQSLGSVQSIVH